ncbi:MAG TPA: hypothetical protein VMD99_17315 [Terriglobales bacterium]|nr:hypothetical protein [Terriglobales bacterium]
MIPTYKQWVQDTSLNVLKPRSSQLKAVDTAIQQYETMKTQDNLFRIKNAFEDWKRFKGPQWERSERNGKRALTLLNTELNRVADYRTYQITHFSLEELSALAFVARQRKQVIASIFENKKVSFKAAKLKEKVAEAKQKITTTSKQAATYIASRGKTAPPKAATGFSTSDVLRKKMDEMVKSFFGVDGLEQLGDLSGFILDILSECALSVPPVVGHIKDGYDLFTGWAKVGASLYEQFNISDRKYSIDTGAPSAAFDGLHRCLVDETKNQAIGATNATTSFALKTGLAFVDGGAISGPVVGAVSALADFSHQLYLLGMEWRATKGVNRALSNGDLDIRLFKIYPLMGCYLLICGTLSDLIPIDSFGTPGWTDYITNMKKNAFDDIYKSATHLVEASPWEIMGLPKRPVGTSAGIFSEVKRAFSTVSPLSGLQDLMGLRS